MNDERPLLCSICFVAVDLCTCKIDENGLPAHGECLATRELYLSTRKPIARTTRKLAWHPVWQYRKIG